jgi:hypothetical protein
MHTCKNQDYYIAAKKKEQKIKKTFANALLQVKPKFQYICQEKCRKTFQHNLTE